jgi:glycosyltransferase involved in cell wall biosynthesis
LVRRGCPRERLRIVPVGVDLEGFPFRDRPPEGPFTVLQVSRLSAKKGVDTALRAFAKLGSSNTDARLWIVGDGGERDQLTRLAADLGLARRVTFYGAVTSPRIQELMQKAHLGIQPSRVAPNGDREGTPTVLLEFQAVGVDVVATNHADIPSVVAHPEELVPEDDVDGLAAAMTRSMLRSTERRRERARAGRALIESRHDASKIARHLASIYREAISLGNQ